MLWCGWDGFDFKLRQDRAKTYRMTAYYHHSRSAGTISSFSDEETEAQMESDLPEITKPIMIELGLCQVVWLLVLWQFPGSAP